MSNETYLDPKISIGGTHRVGEILATARSLIQALGDPTKGASGDGKVTMEWWFSTPAGPATLYDYKWDAIRDLDEAGEWSIGGHDARVVEYVKSYIREQRAMMKGVI